MYTTALLSNVINHDHSAVAMPQRLTVPSWSAWPSRSLTTPAQLVSQDVPNSHWVVVHAGGALDYLGDPPQGPHVVGVAVGFGAFGQFGLDLVKLFTLDLGSRPARAPSRSPSRPDRRQTLRQSETI